MKLRYLKLENYRSYASAEVELPAGLTALIGPNGAGKSSILEAVSWALFGESRTDKEGIRSDFAPEGAACRVEVAFDLQGTTYRIVRELRGKKSLVAHARLSADGAAAPLAVGPGDVEEQVRRLLGLDRRTFFASVFSKQKQVDALTEIGPGKREEAFRRMLGLDALDDVVKKVRADARDLGNELKGIGEKRRPVKELEEAKAQCRDRIQALKPELEKASEAARAAEADEAAAQKEFERLHALEQRHNVLDKEKAKQEANAARLAKSLEQHRGELKSAQAARKDLEKMRPDLRELEGIRDRLKDLDPLQEKHIEREKLREQKKVLDERVRDDAGELRKIEKRAEPLEDSKKLEESLQKEVEAARKAHEKAQESATHCRAEVESAKREAGKLDTEIDDLKKVGKKGKCPLCRQGLGESYEEALAHVEKERDGLASRLKEARKAEEAAKKAAAEAKGALADREKKHQESKDRLDEVRGVAVEFDTRKKAFQRLTGDAEKTARALEALAGLAFDPREHERLKKRQGELAPLEKASGRLEEAAARIPILEKSIGAEEAEQKEVHGKLEDLAGKMAALGFDAALLKKAKTIQDRTREARSKRVTERNEMEKDRVAREKDLEKAEADIAEEKRLAKLVAEKEHRLGALGALEEVFNAFRQSLTDRIRPALAAKAGRLLAGTTGGRYAQVELDDDYNVKVFDGGEMRPLERFSGGETDLINLCLRIAISQIIAGRGEGRVNLLVLDEVFGSQDPQRKDAILQWLQALSAEFQQVFVITHDEYLKDRMGSVFEVRRPDGVRSAISGV
jgi:exonuclease SbcC